MKRVSKSKARWPTEALALKHVDLISLFYTLPFIGMAITSPQSKRWLTANDRLCEILGYPREELVNKSWTELTHPDDLARDVTEFNRVMAGQTNGYSLDKRFIRKDGSTIDATIDVRCVRKADGNVDFFVATVQDISARKQQEQRILHMAQHDLLTALPNRNLLSDRLAQALLRSQRGKSGLAVLFLDLDQFKPVNDRWGHSAGDELLKAVAQRLQESVRASDTVARVGGDEFVILLSPLETADHAVAVAEKIRVSLNEPFTLAAGHVAQIAASIGVAVYPQHGDTDDTLMRNADNAMYAAKDAGRNRVHVFGVDAPDAGVTTFSAPVVATTSVPTSQ